MLFMVNKKTYTNFLCEKHVDDEAQRFFLHSTLLKILPDEAHNKNTNLIP